MKAILKVTLLSLVLTKPLLARLGETTAQIERRFGTPTKVYRSVPESSFGDYHRVGAFWFALPPRQPSIETMTALRAWDWPGFKMHSYVSGNFHILVLFEHGVSVYEKITDPAGENFGSDSINSMLEANASDCVWEKTPKMPNVYVTDWVGKSQSKKPMRYAALSNAENSIAFYMSGLVETLTQAAIDLAARTATRKNSELKKF